MRSKGEELVTEARNPQIVDPLDVFAMLVSEKVVFALRMAADADD